MDGWMDGWIDRWMIDRLIDQVVGVSLQMLVKQQETQRQIQNAETEKQLQQALSQVTEISKALEEIQLCYQNQVNVSVWCYSDCDAFVVGKCLNLSHHFLIQFILFCASSLVHMW